MEDTRFPGYYFNYTVYTERARRHYVATREATQGPGLWLNSIDGPDARRILPDKTRAPVMTPHPGSSLGAILFTRAGTLMALPFDETRLEAAGEPSVVAQQIAGGHSTNVPHPHSARSV